MPAINKLIAPRIVETSVSYGDEQVRFAFDANKVTLHWAHQIQERLAEQDILTSAKALHDVLTGWDILGDDEQTPHPLTVESLAALPIQLVNEMVTALHAAAAPGAAEGNASSASINMPPSDSTPPAVTLQNGQVTSPLPTVSASPSPT